MKKKISVPDVLRALLRSMDGGLLCTSILYGPVWVDVTVEDGDDDVGSIYFYPKPSKEILPYFKIREYTCDLAAALRGKLRAIIPITRESFGRYPRARFQYSPRLPRVGELFSAFDQSDTSVSVDVYRCMKKVRQGAFVPRHGVDLSAFL